MRPEQTPGITATAVGWLAVAVLSFLGVSRLAWQGRLGFAALALFALAGLGYFFSRRGCSETARGWLDGVAKAVFTVAGLVALLRHPVHVDEVSLPIHAAITQYVTTWPMPRRDSGLRIARA